ncbi:MAG: hypothetical protein M1835_008209 [Candelina submexicana]|nr:MAG: hypothetical protein M1835_008209 [Candelina submexicana]
MALKDSSIKTPSSRRRKISYSGLYTFLTIFLLLLSQASTTQATEVCNKCPDPNRFSYPGVGFDLTLDYGTSVLYFPNRTYAIVAKIEGGPAYKRLISASAREAQHRFDNPPQDDPFTESQGASPASNPGPARRWLTRIQTAFNHNLPQHLPKAQQRTPQADPNTLPLTQMLQSLKTATEAYLSAPLPAIGISGPHILTPSHRQLLHSAMNSLNLECSSYPIFAPIAASWANDIGYPLNYEATKEQLVLAIDYNKSALTMSLLTEEGGVFETQKVAYAPQLGSDALYAKDCGRPNCSILDRQEIYRKKLVAFSSEFLRGGHPGGYWTENERENGGTEIVLFGDQAPNLDFHRFLEDMFENHTYDTSDLAEKSDPIFAAAMGVARVAKDTNDYPNCIINEWCQKPVSIDREL